MPLLVSYPEVQGSKASFDLSFEALIKARFSVGGQRLVFANVDATKLDVGMCLQQPL